MKKLLGIIPIVNTVFDDEGRLDIDGQLRLVNYLIESGAHGLGLFGNASEGYALSAQERTLLQKAIVREVNGRVPLVVSSGHTGTQLAVELSKEAQGLGADALMVLPPYYLKTDGDGMMHYFAVISEAVNIPIMVQDAPLMTQVAMPAALLARMGREIENVRYVKVEAPPTAPKVSALRSMSPELTLLGGLNAQFFPEEFQRGAVGTMPGSDLIPELVEIWNSLQAENAEDAWGRFTQILPLLRFELQPGLGVSAMKHNLVARGIIGSARVRHPTATLDEEGLNELAWLRVRAAERWRQPAGAA